jgi:predicted alpha/beta-hydrolase family hydrolase
MRRHASLLAARALHVLTFDFPYMAARRKAPDRPPVLEAAFRDAVAAAVGRGGAHLDGIVVAGKSMGGRMATHVASQPDAWTAPVPLVGAAAFGYPLIPPGARGGDRVSHLARLAVPLLIVQGTRDTFGGPDQIRAATRDVPRVTVHEVPTGDHSLKVLASAGVPQPAVDEGIADTVARWIRDLLPAR